MKLKDWREREGLTQKQLAQISTGATFAVLGERRAIPQQTVHAAESGRVPRIWLGQLFYVVSDGAVTPNDFYDLPPLEKVAAQ